MKYCFLLFCYLFISTLFAQEEKWTLEKCITFAEESNLSVVNSRINEQISNTQEEITKTQKIPSVNGQFNNSLNFGFQPTALGIYEYNQSYRNNLSFDANMIIYNRGKIKHQIEKSGINIQIQQLNTQTLIQDISLQIAAFYLQVILNKELQGIAKDQLDNTEEQLDKTQKLYDAGSIPYANLVEQQAKLASDQSQLENSKINVDRALFNLAIFLQIEDYEDFAIEDVVLPDSLVIEDINVQDVIETAFEKRPEVKQAELQVQAAQKDIDIAKTTSWPTISGGYNLGSSYFDFWDIRDDNLFKQWYDNHNQQLYVGIQIPIFNKANRLNVKQAEQNKELISQNITQQKLQLTQDIQTAYFDANAAFQQYQNLKIAYESAQVNEDYAKKSYDAGRTTIYDYNVIRTNTIIAKSQMINAKYDYYFKLKVLDFYAGRPITIDYVQ